MVNLRATLQFTAVLLFEMLLKTRRGSTINQRGNHPAWTAPRSPEVDEHWHRAVKDQLFESTVGYGTSCPNQGNLKLGRDENAAES